MAITVKCDCGKTLKLKDNAAGKRLRCPDCGGSVEVPEQDEYGEAYEEVIEEEYESRPSRRESGRSRSGGGRGRRPAPKQSANTSLIIGLAVGGVTAVGVAVLVFTLMRRPDPGLPVQAPPVAASPDPAKPNPTPNPADSTNPAIAAQHAATAPNAAATPPATTQTPPAQPTPVQPVAAAVQGYPVWVVLSNFKQGQSSGPFDKPYTIDYRIAAGAPEAGKKYVLYIGQGSGGGFIEHYMEVDITLQNQGTVQFAIGPGVLGTGKLSAHMALKTGHQKWSKVSGEIAQGGTETAAQPPPTVQQLAGAAAVGKVIAIANAKNGNGFAGGREITVDCVVQTPLPPDGFFFLVAKNASGDGIEFDITQSLRRAQVGETVNIGGRIIGPPVGGPLTLQIEKRRSPGRIRFNNETPEILSNPVSTN